MSRGFVRYVVCAVGAPVTAEFLLGDQYLSGGTVGGQVAELILYIAFYGSAAVLIREVTRRGGRGWPTMLLLGAAFGIIEEGLLTQSLFNPHYLGLHKLAYGFLPGLGIGLPWTVFVLTLHVVWSIATPIAVTEAVFPGYERWLGPKRTAGLAALYVAAGALICLGSMSQTTFRPSTSQLVVTVCLALAAVAAAFGFRRVPSQLAPASPVTPRGAVGLITAFVLLSVFHLGHEAGPAWLACAVMLLVLVLLGVLLVRWRFPAGAVGVGAQLVYMWVGLVNSTEHGAAAVAEQVILVVLVLGTLVGFGVHRHRLDTSAGYVRIDARVG